MPGSLAIALETSDIQERGLWTLYAHVFYEDEVVVKKISTHTNQRYAEVASRCILRTANR